MMKKKLFCMVGIVLLMLGCSQDDYLLDVDEKGGMLEEIYFPESIEKYGKAVAKEIRITAQKMMEINTDYSAITDSQKMKEKFLEDWYKASPTMTRSRNAGVDYPTMMDATDFMERYNTLTSIQLYYIQAIIDECRKSASYSEMLKSLIHLSKDIYLHVPTIEQERLLNIISVLYYGVQEISHLHSLGVIFNTSDTNIQLLTVKTRSEMETDFVPAGCTKFLTTVWTIAVGEPTPAGEIVASIITIIVAGELIYEVITCKKEDEKENLRDYCARKYTECMETPLGAENSGSVWGTTACAECLSFCNAQGYWHCPLPR